MIYVFDELSGFIHAASLIRPTGYEGMDTKSVLKKLKTLSFAAQVNREDITDAISRSGPKPGRNNTIHTGTPKRRAIENVRDCLMRISHFIRNSD